MAAKKTTVKNAKTEIHAERFVKIHNLHRRTSQEEIVKILAERHPDVTSDPLRLIQIVNAIAKEARKVAPPKKVSVHKALKDIAAIRSSFEDKEDRIRVTRGLAHQPEYKGATLAIGNVEIAITPDVMETLLETGPAFLVLDAIRSKLPDTPKEIAEFDEKIAEMEKSLSAIKAKRDSLAEQWTQQAKEATGVNFDPETLLPIVETKAVSRRSSGRKIADYRDRAIVTQKGDYTLKAYLDENGKIWVWPKGEGFLIVAGESPSKPAQELTQEFLGRPFGSTQNAGDYFGFFKHDPESLPSGRPSDMPKV